MANQLTLKVMETIVKRCEGYEPLPERQSSSTSPYGNFSGSTSGKVTGIKPQEEALLSSVIHRQVDGSGKFETVKKEHPLQINLSKSGVVHLDELLKELKK